MKASKMSKKVVDKVVFHATMPLLSTENKTNIMNIEKQKVTVDQAIAEIEKLAKECSITEDEKLNSFNEFIRRIQEGEVAPEIGLEEAKDIAKLEVNF